MAADFIKDFIFIRQAAEFINRDELKTRLKEKFHDFISYEKRKLEAIYTTAESFQIKIQEIVVKNKKAGYEELISSTSEGNESDCFSYVCM